MTPAPASRKSTARVGQALVALSCTALAGCYDESDDDYYYYGDPYDPYATYCEAGVDQGEIDRGKIRALGAGEGVGATVEYLGDGDWRVAVTCDLGVNPSAQGQPCGWIVVVGALEGTIKGFEGFDLELTDVIEWYPGTQGSSVEDAVRLESITDYDVDGFTFETAAGAGIWISASLDGACGEPFLIWLEEGRDTSTTSEMLELIPEDP